MMPIADPSIWSDAEYIRWSNFWKAIRFHDLDLFTKAINSGLDIYLQWPAFKENRVLIVNGKETWFSISSSQSGFPLHAAARIYDEAFVQLLLSRGADVKAKSLDGSSALHESVSRSNNKVSALLIKHGADVEYKIIAAYPYYGHDLTPLHIACKRSDLKSTKILLNAGAQPDARAVENSLFNSDYHVLQLLLARGGLLDTTSPGAQYAFSEAAWKGQTLLQRLLTRNYAIADFVGLSETMLEEAILECNGPFEVLVKNLRTHNTEWMGQPEASTSKTRLCIYCKDLNSTPRPFPTSRQVEEVKAEACPVCRIIIDQKLWCKGSNEHQTYAQHKLRLKFADDRPGHEGQSLDRYMPIGYPRGQFARILGKLQTSPDVGTHSEGTIALARAWLLNCLTDHKSCSALNTGLPNLPTRVIDVGNDDQQPHLCITHARSGIYCALSYCWGRKPFLRTTVASLVKHQKGILLAEFPKTLKDAIVICRQLSIQYIWIDALCIVQDDSEDWERESKNMTSIYRSAIVTIVASAAEDTSVGCFQPRTRNRIWPVRVPDRLSAGKRAEAMAVHSCGNWHCSGDLSDKIESTDPSVPQDDFFVFLDFEGRPKEPVDQRAWCTQEYFMSSRILYWSHELYWECQCSVASERQPGGSRDLNQATRRIVREASLEAGPIGADHDRIDAILNDWELVVEDYAQRHITMQSDRLIALAGMASAVGKVIRCEYLAGLWGGEHLCRSLLWEVRDLGPTDLKPSSLDQKSHIQNVELNRGKKNNGKMSRKSLFPSWSWASCISGARRVVFRRWDEPMKADRKTSRNPLETIDFISARVDDIFTVNAIKGEIIVSRRLRRMKIIGNHGNKHGQELARNLVQIIPVEETIDQQDRTVMAGTDDDYQLSESPPTEAILAHPIIEESAPKEWIDGLNYTLRDKMHHRSNANNGLGLFPSEASTNMFGDDFIARLQQLQSIKEQQGAGELRPVPISLRRHYWIKDDLDLDNKQIWCLSIALWMDLLVGLCLERTSTDNLEFRRIGLFTMERSGNGNWEEDVTFESWKDIPKVEVCLV